MDFSPNEQQLELQANAQEFAKTVLAPNAARWDRDGGFPTDNLAEAARRGLMAVNLPKTLGGAEAGVVSYSLAITECARACAATTVAMCVNNMVAEVVAAFGTEDQRTEWIPKLADGRAKVGAFALSEAGAGSDPGGMLTRARKTNRGWVLEGSKLWVTSGTDAGLFVVWAKTNDTPGTGGISCFLVAGDAPGVEPGKPEHKMGLHGSTTTPLELREVELPDTALLGQEGRGFRIAMMALDGGRIGIASQSLGIGRAALDAATAHARERQQFGRAIGGFQGVQWKLADMATDLDAARLLTLRAAWLKEHNKAFTREAAIAKVFGTERSFQACSQAIEVLGGAGYRRDNPVERYFRDVRVTMIYEGTSEVQRIVISRDIMRRFAEAS